MIYNWKPAASFLLRGKPPGSAKFTYGKVVWWDGAPASFGHAFTLTQPRLES